MLRVGLVGLGKMGLSHLAMFRAHPDVQVEAVVDSAGYILDVLSKYTGVRTFKDYSTMLESVALDAVVIATPSKFHHSMVSDAIDRQLHVFCEKPLTLTAAESIDLARRAETADVVTQVGYHNRFVGAFQEVKSLLDAGAIGTVTHALAEAYGPVVLRAKGGTWRSRKSDGGGCLYDYAAHPVDLLNWYLGEPVGAAGTVMGSIFSADTDDEVYSTLRYRGGASAQVSVNWSDESCRKMTTKLTIWGTAGRIQADRQECQTYLRHDDALPPGYGKGWNVRYTTDLTVPVWFYLRGEEYSAQIDHFVQRIVSGGASIGVNTFASASLADLALEMMNADAAESGAEPAVTYTPAAMPRVEVPSGWERARAVMDKSRQSAGELVRAGADFVGSRVRKGANR